MRKTRVYVQTNLSIGQESRIEGDAAHHLVNVLRLKAGQTIFAFNGTGGCFEAEIIQIEKKAVVILPQLFSQGNRESPLQLTLVQGISRGQHMDYTVQKAVELGVSRIVPVFTEFSNVKLSEDRSHKRIEHWNKIIIGACEQSGRNIVPPLEPPLPFSEWISKDTSSLRLILHPDADQALAALELPITDMMLLCGPEGGLSDREVEFARASGYRAVTLGPRILRTETAALAAIAVCQSRFGDM